MLQEKHLIYTDKSTYIDREENILHDCVVFSSVLNYNGGIYTKENLEELVALGNSKKNVYSYIGHSKDEVTDDRLTDRIGEWVSGSFRVDGNLVRASLKLFDVNEVNPKIEKNFNEYVLKLAETIPEKCGFSVVIWTRSADDEMISIKDLVCIDLVEFPATTIAMFSKEVKKIMVEETKISALETLFGSLIEALKSGSEYVGIKMELIKELESLGFEPEKEIEIVEEEEKNSEISIQDLVSKIESLTKIVEEMKQPKEEIEKNSKVVIREFSVIAPVEDIVPGVDHTKVYNEMIASKKFTEAAKYYKKNIKG